MSLLSDCCRRWPAPSLYPLWLSFTAEASIRAGPHFTLPSTSWIRTSSLSPSTTDSGLWVSQLSVLPFNSLYWMLRPACTCTGKFQITNDETTKVHARSKFGRSFARAPLWMTRVSHKLYRSVRQLLKFNNPQWDCTGCPKSHATRSFVPIFLRMVAQLSPTFARTRGGPPNSSAKRSRLVPPFLQPLSVPQLGTFH